MSSRQPHSLDHVFKARSACFVGVSSDASKSSGVPLRIMMRHKFPGPIYPVNPKAETIEGLKCYASVADLPEAPDIAYITVPAPAVPAAIEACGKRGIPSCSILTSGFEEVEGGGDLAGQVRAAAEKYDMALVGPNSEGTWSVKHRVILTFGSAAKRDTLHHGNIAIVSQSGAMGGGLARRLQESGYGCSYFVSVGNETILTAFDYMDYLIDQDDVDVILVFLEGIIDGWRLMPVAEKARRNGVRIVVLKSGNSAAGRSATASHTGKVSTPFGIYRDLFDEAGIIMVRSLVELLEAGQLFQRMPLPARATGDHGGLGVMSVPGGARALVADQCAETGVPLAKFTPETVATLRDLLPKFGVAENPTDVTGEVVSNPELLDKSADLVINDPNTEATLLQLGNGGPRDIHTKREAFTAISARSKGPVILSLLADTVPDAAHEELSRAGIFPARDCGEGVKYLSWLYRAREIADTSYDDRAGAPTADLDRPTGWRETADLLADNGVPVCPWTTIAAGDNVAEALAGLTFPVAVKALPEDAAHKTELGLVHLGVTDAEAVARAAASIRETIGQDRPVLVQSMAAEGVELLIAARRDPDFGPILIVGAGGRDVELLEDVRHVSLPLSKKALRHAVGKLGVDAHLQGYRGAPPADRDALLACAAAVGTLFQRLPASVTEIELNPVIVHPDGAGVSVVDVLIG
ncbi:acetate--CoA ligase family protein [Fodinicurvata sp. EGI_FJ10296]|uniref:acetate--CoA ligase family protein n=1 Tax=Fodinicurvata sp. EGI_FJ10296 TaxID=3231908 RepID=UPI003452EE22